MELENMDLERFGIAVECRFSLRIPNKVAIKITTPRKLIDYLATRLGATDAPGLCLSQRAFYRVRSALQCALAIDRAVIHPQSALMALVPATQRRQRWASVQAAAGAHCWPELCRPAWLCWTLFAFCVVSSAVGFNWLCTAGDCCTALVVTLGAWLLVSPILARATFAWKTEFPWPDMVVADLARFILAYTPLADARSGWTRQQIASVVHALIAAEVGVVEYTDDSRWVEDMGLE